MKRLMLYFFLLCGAALSPAVWAASDFRLPADPRPLSYELQLQLDPREPGYSGMVAIDLEMTAATEKIRINADRLTLGAVRMVVAGQAWPATVAPGDSQAVILRFSAALPAGRHRLLAEFSGRLDDLNTEGLFRQKVGGDWYVFSQFEAISARRAFPCFDDPRWKTPWQITLVVPDASVAVSNMPIEAEKSLGNGLRQVRFAATPPLPSYLLALGVGPFDVVDGGLAGRNHIPLRYFVPRGRAAEAAYAARATSRLLEMEENYFDQPFPFPKLDSLAIPVTVGFGAMENAGLITYEARSMLAPPGADHEEFRQRFSRLAAHEIAHQWFGDLVTMAWWDDLWLNESFATWMARKVVEQAEPAWGGASQRLRERTAAMEEDMLSSARQVRRPVQEYGDLITAFDRITYEKGGAVLAMFEAAVGRETFQAGVRRYLARHAWGNATAADFFAAIAADQPRWADAMAGFVERPGVPLLDVRTECAKGRATLHLRQQRFLPARPGQESPPWHLPVCVRTAQLPQGHCVEFDGRDADFSLPGEGCQHGLNPNAGGLGYYLSALQPGAMAALPQAPLAAREAAALLADFSLMGRAGVIPYDQLLPLAAGFAQAEPEVAYGAALLISQIPDAALPGGAAGTEFADWIRRTLGPRALQLGWRSGPGESESLRRLRHEVMPLVALRGADQSLRDQAVALARQYLEGGADLGDMRATLLSVAQSVSADRLMAPMVARIRRSNDAGERRDLYRALAAVREPALSSQVLPLIFDPGLDPREAVTVLWAAAETDSQVPSLVAFLAENTAPLLQRLPEHYEHRLARWGARICDGASRQRLISALAPYAALPGVGKTMAATLESTDLCLTHRDAIKSALGRLSR